MRRLREVFELDDGDAGNGVVAGVPHERQLNFPVTERIVPVVNWCEKTSMPIGWHMVAGDR